MNKPLVALKNVTKRFPGVVALDSCSVEFYAGEVHGLMGENGAGKSTLIKLLTGAYQPDEGEILLEGEPIRISGPKQAMALGLTAIYQELNTIPRLTVWENIFLGRELRGPGGLLRTGEMKRRAVSLLEELGQRIEINAKVGTLGMGHQQMVEICKALSTQSRLIIMDEPTSSLSGGEVGELMRTVENLRNKGLAIVFISHHMEEVFQICDRLTVLRDGAYIATRQTAQTTPDELIYLMVGRDINQQYPKERAVISGELLRIEGFSAGEGGAFQDVSFSVCAGEVLGISGLVGAGRTQVARALFGVDRKAAGTVYIRGEQVEINSPKAAIQAGLAFLTEDRKGEGLVLGNTVGFNINLSTFPQSRGRLLLSTRKIRQKSRESIQRLNIKTPSANTKVRGLSGGNQQKVVIAKWLQTDADVFIFDEPTRGLDVGAKTEVYNIINALAAQGKAILMISSELPEVMGMSDRVLVMHEGRVEKIFSPGEATEEAIMKAASGGV